MRTLELALQQKGFSKIAGIDEAGGRGGLGGPGSCRRRYNRCA